MNHLERTLVALAEINPPAAAAVRSIGANRDGLALPGFLGWLPAADRLDVARACFLAIGPEGPEVYCHGTPEEMAAWMVAGHWLQPRSEDEQARIVEAVNRWAWHQEHDVHKGARLAVTTLLDIYDAQAQAS